MTDNRHPLKGSLLSDGAVGLRALEPTDAALVYELENDSATWVDGGAVQPYSMKTVDDYIATSTNDIFVDRQLRLVVECEGVGVGFLDFYEFDPRNRRAGVGIAVAAPYRRKGIARRALALAERYAGGFVGMAQLWAVVRCANAASLGLFESAGYEAAGTLRGWVLTGPQTFGDAVMFQRLIGR